MSSLTVLVTRPGTSGSKLCELIADQGDQALHMPTIAFALPKNKSLLKKAIKLLGEQDWIIFVSPQAVLEAVPLLREECPTLPQTLRMAAIGKGTATALKAAGYEAVFPDQEWTAEGLLQMPIFHSVAGKKIAIVRGDGGREVLESGFIARKAIVSTIIVYQRVIPDVDVTKYVEKLKQGNIDLIVCASYTSVDHLKKMIGQAGWPYLKKVPLIVVSERIRQLASEAGFENVLLAENASHEAILKLIKGMHDDREKKST